MPRTKPPAQLQREIDAALTIAPMMPAWRRAVAAYRLAIAKLRDGRDPDGPARTAREKLYKLINEAAKHAPLSYRDPAVEALNAEFASLPSIANAAEAGQAARAKLTYAKIAELRDVEREEARQSPTWWMRK